MITININPIKTVRSSRPVQARLLHDVWRRSDPYRTTCLVRRLLLVTALQPTACSPSNAPSPSRSPRKVPRPLHAGSGDLCGLGMAGAGLAGAGFAISDGIGRHPREGLVDYGSTYCSAKDVFG
ncbi:hypothetical protein NEOLEDRAFT_400265 [Neolentinus lepideus HHB14362 ss-1]|uniref:Uncharacterized protein n=1 Tax=Neolentinus lepideus HHB14362 ss-1 TaxID=1314782 RepID=A0A165SAB1_9AGAM|nr:hypothetical protein NEOLEDRAFT_400265 [Neolentinus lepideus HHB14362 ss-1]